MNFKEFLKEALDNKIKVIVKGRSGWGKSEMISQVAEEMGLTLIDFRLSEILPEDLVGIPKLREDYYDYVPPRWLYEVINNPSKKYLLFLDEITQGTPEVLNICYKIFDKVTKIGEHILENVLVVGATNYSDESDYINELPLPLKNRACMIELTHDKLQAANYLIDKYELDKKCVNNLVSILTKSTPRDLDVCIRLKMNNASKDLCIPFVGFTGFSSLSFLNFGNKSNLSDFQMALTSLETGEVTYKEENYAFSDVNTLGVVYDLTPEEFEIVKNSFDSDNFVTSPKLAKGKKDVGVLVHWLMDNLGNGSVTSLLPKVLESKDFNLLSFMKGVKLTPNSMTLILNICDTYLGFDNKKTFSTMAPIKNIPLDIMKKYRDDMPWDYYVENRSSLTPNKLDEFKLELEEHDKRTSLDKVFDGVDLI